MNKNNMTEIDIISELSEVLYDMSKDDICTFFKELLTTSEITTLSKRWRILKMLNEGCSQREIAKALGVSLCKITKGAKILKSSKSVSKRIIEGVQNDTNKITTNP